MPHEVQQVIYPVPEHLTDLSWVVSSWLYGGKMAEHARAFRKHIGH